MSHDLSIWHKQSKSKTKRMTFTLRKFRRKVKFVINIGQAPPTTRLEPLFLLPFASCKSIDHSTGCYGPVR